MMPCGVEKLGARVYYNLDEALRGVQVIMMLRLQLERQGIALFPTIREYARLYGLTTERVELAESWGDCDASGSDQSRGRDRSGGGR